MMMPANYSVIAENEMTYVNGGASFIDAIGAVTAPIWTLDNVMRFLNNVFAFRQIRYDRFGFCTYYKGSIDQITACRFFCGETAF